jgi:hypothetical protein
MAVQRIWLLNFDADDELACPVGYTPSRAMLARFASLAERAEGLVPPSDLVIDETARDERFPGGCEGRAFCPTPRAIRAWRRAGATVPDVPSLDALRRVNHRAFSAELGQTLPFARFVRSWDELEATLASFGGPWLLKRAFGFAGRGRQRLRSNQIDGSVEPFVRTSLESAEGLQVEPWVERVGDVAVHGFISKEGVLTQGVPTQQEVDATGAWLTSLRLPEGALSAAEHRDLLGQLEKAARALFEAGYFGPFGIDAFRWRDTRGSLHFNPRSEVNARYSMAWAVGMGERRPDLVVTARPT